MIYQSHILFRSSILSLSLFSAIPWYNTMIALTVDRYLKVRLNIKYNHYISNRTSHIVIIVSWIMGGISYIVIAIVRWKLRKDIVLAIRNFVLIPYSAISIVVLFFTYSYIYRKMKSNTERDHRVSVSVGAPGGGETASKRHLFVPLGIFLTFILFAVFPTVVYSAVIPTTKKDQSMEFISITLVTDLCCLSDVFIYILFNVSLRRRFFRIFTRAPIEA